MPQLPHLSYTVSIDKFLERQDGQRLTLLVLCYFCLTSCIFCVCLCLVLGVFLGGHCVQLHRLCTLYPSLDLCDTVSLCLGVTGTGLFECMCVWTECCSGHSIWTKCCRNPRDHFPPGGTGWRRDGHELYLRHSWESRSPPPLYSVSQDPTLL